MVQVNMHEAKAQLSRLGELACKGERVVIAKNGKPYLDLVPHQEEKRREPRQLGGYEGQIKIKPGFEWSDEEIDEYLNLNDPNDPLKW